MRIGVFCTYENHERDFARCFDMQTRYVQHAEALGIDEAWVAEHHFDPDAVSPSILDAARLSRGCDPAHTDSARRRC